MPFPTEPGRGGGLASGEHRNDGSRKRSRGDRKRAAAGALVDEAALENAALRYLARYDSSAANLRRVLRRKLRRSLDAGHGGDASALFPAIDALVEQLVERRLIDDRRYAEALVRRMRRRGGSTARVRATLASRGVDDAVREDALRAGAESSTGWTTAEVRDPEWAAACTFARRRRLGPWGSGDRAQREARREKELGALARAGFGFDVAERIIEAATVEVLEDAER